jgi:hypothetical protein
MTWCRQMIERTAPPAAYLGCRAHPPAAGGAAAEDRQRGSRARWERSRPVVSEPQLADSTTKIHQAGEDRGTTRGVSG